MHSLAILYRHDSIFSAMHNENGTSNLRAFLVVSKNIDVVGILRSRVAKNSHATTNWTHQHHSSNLSMLRNQVYRRSGANRSAHRNNTARINQKDVHEVVISCSDGRIATLLG